jgi:hypothetical protein
MSNFSDADLSSDSATVRSCPTAWLSPNRTIKIHGNSGCSVSLKSEQGRVVVEKTCSDSTYLHRLRLQIDKQRIAQESNPLPFIKIPIILSEKTNENIYTATMEHLIFPDCMDFFSIASKQAIDQMVHLLIQYVEHNIQMSHSESLPSSLFIGKLEEVEANLGKTSFKSRYKKLINNAIKSLHSKQKMSIPIGPCHGDLTFSNIMIANDQKSLGFIDFLDSYLDSPLIDIAKLRQDSQFFWSYLMTESIDKTRFLQIMKYIDKQIENRFKKEKWYKEELRLIQAINLLRIAPYAKKESVHRFIINGLNLLRI